jgi:hypothetical protein
MDSRCAAQRFSSFLDVNNDTPNTRRTDQYFTIPTYSLGGLRPSRSYSSFQSLSLSFSLSPQKRPPMNDECTYVCPFLLLYPIFPPYCSLSQASPSGIASTCATVSTARFAPLYDALIACSAQSPSAIIHSFIPISSRRPLHPVFRVMYHQHHHPDTARACRLPSVPCLFASLPSNPSLIICTM